MGGTTDLAASMYISVLDLVVSTGGQLNGFILAYMKIKIINKTTNINPGRIAPANKSIAVTGSGAKLPTNIAASSFAPCKIVASKTKTIEGGIICPNVPAAQIVPVAIF